MTKEELLSKIDWQKVLAAKRYAGGHEEVMQSIFGNNAEVIAYHRDHDYQGELCYAYQMDDGFIAIISDYFGSCGGCDAWENASDADAESMVTSLVSSARLMKNIDEAIEFCETGCKEAEQFSHGRAIHLVEDLKSCRAYKIEMIKGL